MKSTLLVPILAIFACAAVHFVTFQHHAIGWTPVSKSHNFVASASDGKLFLALSHRLLVPGLTANGSIVRTPLFQIEGYGTTRMVHSSTTGPVWPGFAIPIFTLALLPGSLLTIQLARKLAPNP